VKNQLKKALLKKLKGWGQFLKKTKGDKRQETDCLQIPPGAQNKIEKVNILR